MNTPAINPSLANVLASMGIKDVSAFVAEVQKSQANRLPLNDLIGGALEKSTFGQSASATTGLTYYDLELGAKFVFPALTPLRNEIPRVSGKGGIQAAWRAVTGINTTGIRIGVSGGNRGAVQVVSTQDYTAAYKGIGLETSVDFEAQYAGMGFDDIRAIGAKVGLEATMLGEEPLLLGGNSSVNLGTTPTPTLTAKATGGALSDSTQSVIVVALALDAYINGSVVNGIQGSITRANADGSTDTFGGGSARKSAAATQVLNAGTAVQGVNCSVAAVAGAAGYAWFWGLAGAEVLGAITPFNSYIILGAAAGTMTAASLGANDNSTNNLVFDGLIYQAVKSGSNSYVFGMATGVAGTGSTLTGDGAGGIVEIDAALKDRWDLYKLGFDTIWVSSQVAQDMSKKILAGQANGAQRFVFESEQSALGGGVMVRTYLNKFSLSGANVINIRIHPNMPPGMILMTLKALPYPVNNVGNLIQVRTRQEYYQIEWPLRARRYESGVYADEVLQHYFPPALGLIYNIAPG